MTPRETESDPADRYSRLWADGRPDLDAFLADAGPLAPDDLATVLRVDQRQRWQAGERVPAEEYVRRVQDTESELDLIYGEYLARERLGESPDPEEFCRRFPVHATVLCQQVALHRAIGDGTQAYGTTQPYVPPQPEVLPRVFGPYRLLEVLGRGGMGTVYLADDTRLGRRVALKMPRFDPGRAGEASERFRREMRAAAVVRHSYLCPVYEVGRLDGVDYFTMPHVTGAPLSARLAREGAQPQREAARLVQRIAEGMQAAHRVGVVHRDLKPSNVLLDEGGDPVVTDFGLARRLGPDDPRMTPSGATIGTAAYLPPEQIGCAPEAVGPRSDVYSLGVILYELLTGRPPFTGVGHEVLAMVLNTDPTPPSRLRARIDPRLEAACLKAMAKDPAHRFGSMTEFADAVRPVAEEVPNPAPRRWAALLAAALVFAVLAGIAIWLATRSPGSGTTIPTTGQSDPFAVGGK